MPDRSFSFDIAAIRAQLRARMDACAQRLDPGRVIAVLHEIRATHLVCWLQYSRHATWTARSQQGAVSRQFTQHDADERSHASRLRQRINQLAAAPQPRPRSRRLPVSSSPDTYDLLYEYIAAERLDLPRRPALDG